MFVHVLNSCLYSFYFSLKKNIFSSKKNYQDFSFTYTENFFSRVKHENLCIIFLIKCIRITFRFCYDFAYVLKCMYVCIKNKNIRIKYEYFCYFQITQCFYAILGLSCDVLSLSNERKHTSLLKSLKSMRDLLFSAILFPVSIVSIYNYNYYLDTH